MQCESCQEREAAVDLTVVSGDGKRRQRLCAQCARRESGGGKGPPSKAPAKKKVVKKINVVLGHLEAESREEARCPECGLTYQRFRKIGRLGCPACYAAFGEPLRRLLRRIHGADAHVGRGPRPEEGPEAGPDLDQLRRELRQAVEEEAYEKAAALRDRIARREGS